MKSQKQHQNQQMSTLLKTILLVLVMVVAYQTFVQKKDKAAPLIEDCIISCPSPNSSKASSAERLCLTLEQGTEKCFYLNNIILFKTYNGKSVLYDYDGNGLYVKETLKQIEQKLKTLTQQFFQINRQDLVNMIYTKKLDKCEHTLYLCGEFDCSVPRRKFQTVEQLMHQYCTLMCQ